MAKLSKIELIKYYEKMLEKVKIAHNPDNYNCELIKDSCNDYIKYAEEQLEAVKNGRDW